MAKRLIPVQFKTELIESFISSTVNDNYYAFIGDHITEGSTDEDVAAPNQSERSLRINPYRNMILGKKLTSENFLPMVRRHNWTQDVVYTPYDDVNANLFNEAFFVCVDEEESVHVYKCLDNNNGSKSVAIPSIEQVIENEDYYQTMDDGYLWKYMYSIPDTIFRKFETEKYIPVLGGVDERIDRDTLITPGSIDVIKVENPGQNYNNYISGILEQDDLVPDNELEYRLISSAKIAPGFYANTWMYLTDSNKESGGQYRRIINSTQRNGRVFVELEEGFTIPPVSQSAYAISPIVDIFGDGTETIKADARAIINPNASNSVSRVEILNPGQDYSYAIATIRQGVSANSLGGSDGVLIDPTPATVRPILPPSGGHASNPARELGCSTLMIQTTFSNTENGTVPSENTFAQFGLIENPLFSNVEINYIKKSDGIEANTVGSDGDFSVGETVIQFKKIELCGTVNLTNISANTSTFKVSSDPIDDSPGYNRFINIGDLIYVNNPNSELNNFIARVTSLSTDGREIQLASLNGGLPIWEDDTDVYETKVYLAIKIAEAVVRESNVTGRMYVERLTNELIRNELLIGAESSAIAFVNSVRLSNRPDEGGFFGFNTFIQATRCIGNTGSGGVLFAPNELVYQGSNPENGATMRARVHSINQVDNSADYELLLTNIEGVVNTAVRINSAESSATMSPNFNKYTGDLDPTSGTIVYLQNDVPVERNSTSTEQVRVILEF